jgi:hypothetical protein
MITETTSKNSNGGQNNVKRTLYEMLGPTSDGLETNKLSSLLGMDSTNYLEDKDESYKKNLSLEGVEDMSTADYNLSGKEANIQQMRKELSKYNV